MTRPTFGFDPPPPADNPAALRDWLIRFRTQVTAMINHITDLGAGLQWNATSDKMEVDQDALDHGTLGGLGDDDHPQYKLATDLASETTGKGGSLIGFDDTGSLTTAVDVNDIINRLLAFVSYVESSVGTGALDFSDADNSHHLGSVA